MRFPTARHRMQLRHAVADSESRPSPLTVLRAEHLARRGSGTLELRRVRATSVATNSDTYLTGNLAQPCPRCSATGSPASRGTGPVTAARVRACMCTTRARPATRVTVHGRRRRHASVHAGRWPCLDGSHVGVITVNLSPLTTGTASRPIRWSLLPGPGSYAGRPQDGCFGSTACRRSRRTARRRSHQPGVTYRRSSRRLLHREHRQRAWSTVHRPSGPGAVSLPGTFFRTTRGRASPSANRSRLHRTGLDFPTDSASARWFVRP